MWDKFVGSEFGHRRCPAGMKARDGFHQREREAGGFAGVRVRGLRSQFAPGEWVGRRP